MEVVRQFLLRAVGGYESREGKGPTVRELAAEAGVDVRQVPDPGTHPWLSAMFAYYDRHGLPVGTRTLSMLLGRQRSQG